MRKNWLKKTFFEMEKTNSHALILIGLAAIKPAVTSKNWKLLISAGLTAGVGIWFSEYFGELLERMQKEENLEETGHLIIETFQNVQTDIENDNDVAEETKVKAMELLAELAERCDYLVRNDILVEDDPEYQQLLDQLKEATA